MTVRPTMLPGRRSLPLAFAIALVVPLAAGPRLPAASTDLPAVRLERSSLVNDLEFPIVALVRERRIDAIDTFSTTFVEARASHPVVVRDEASGRVQFEPISLDVARRPKQAECPADATHTLFDVPGIEATLASWHFEETPTGRATVAAAEAVAQIEYQEKQDEKDRIRMDPLRMMMDLNRIVPSDPVGAAIATEQRRADSMSALASDIADLALAWSDVDRAKVELYYDQAKTLEPLVEQSRLALAAKRHDFQRVEAESRAGEAFLALVNEHVSRAAETRPPADTVVLSTPTLMCGAAQRGIDYLAVRATSDARAVLVAQASFDSGGPERTIARRVVGTDTWLVPIYWPVDATSVSVTLRASSRSRAVTSAAVSAGHASERQLLASYETAAKKIEKEFKDADFRAAGADSLKTVIIR